MSSRKVWEPFRSVNCSVVGKEVSGEIRVLVYLDAERKNSPPVPTGEMECSGAGECGVEDKEAGCPVFKAFCANLKT